MFAGDEHECLNMIPNDWNDMSYNGCIWYLYFWPVTESHIFGVSQCCLAS